MFEHVEHAMLKLILDCILSCSYPYINIAIWNKHRRMHSPITKSPPY